MSGPTSGPTSGSTAPALVHEEIMGAEPVTGPLPTLERAARALDRRTVWHINTTALGGGVAELLRRTVPQHVHAGIATRWLVTHGNAEFFTLTKQLHHLLHGMPGNGRMPTADDARAYGALTAAQGRAVLRLTGEADIVVLHDPQTLGLAPVLRDAGRHVIWRSHIGTRRASPFVAAAWELLAPHARAVDQFAFSAPAYVPELAKDRPVAILRPCIDPAAPKCRPMPPEEVGALLAAIGLHDPETAGRGTADPVGPDIAGAARTIQEQPLPAPAPTVLQLARWDPLKDMRGVLEAFARYIADATPAHLVLAGPDPDEVADDHENQAVLTDLLERWRTLPDGVRHRVHLVVLRLSAGRANHLVVNALQRRATVVVQKSLEEGFGLVVTEAMHKRRPVVAARVGGIVEQVTDHEHGLLVPPRDHRGFAAAVCRLLGDPGLAAQLGAAAGAHCERSFLVRHEHEGYARLFLRALGDQSAGSTGSTGSTGSMG